MPTAQLRHKENDDCHRKTDPNLKSGDMVWLLPRNIHTTRPSKKLDWKKIGPFKITAKIGSNAYPLVSSNPDLGSKRTQFKSTMFAKQLLDNHTVIPLLKIDQMM